MSLLLGFDIGVSSVGYGIVNEYGEAIDAGVRLFAEGNNDGNEQRRNYRHQRRSIRRKHHRLVRADRLFVKYGLTQYKDDSHTIDLVCSPNITPYHLRVKGLSEPLTNKEVIIALRHLLKHRGTHVLNAYAENEEGNVNENSTKNIIGATKPRLDAGEFVCQIQLERLTAADNGHVRGIENRFLADDYLREAKQILATQSKYNSLISDEFINEFIILLQSRRMYFEGPGKGSIYGWDSIEEWMGRLVGRCVYTGEKRIVKHAPTAELFNLLNDLNNMQIDGEHITFAEKVKLYEDLFKKQISSPKVSKVLQILGKNKDATVTGLRVAGKNKTQIFTELKGWHYINAANKLTGDTVDMKDFSILDEIAKVLTFYQDGTTASVALQKLNLSDEFINELIKLYDSPSGNLFKGTHSLSKAAILIVLEDLWNTPKNQMQLFSEKKIYPKHSSDYISNGQIKPQIVNNMSVSPVTRRAISQTFTVYNDLMKKYSNGFDNITIRLAREENSEAQKKFIYNLQKENEQINSQVKEIIKNKNESALFDKVKLWLLQDGIDLYTGEKIPIEHLLNNSYAYVIGHIIPLSISFDNSFSNKVLTFDAVSQRKGQKTPYQWMQENDAPDYNEFYKRVCSFTDSQKMPKAKRNNLLFKEDITKWEVRCNFINRNLVDTRYACKEVLCTFKNCLEETPTAVHSVNGKFINYLRKCWNLNKNRDLDFSHNAVDALIIAASSLVRRHLNVVHIYDIIEGNGINDSSIINRYTGELVDNTDDTLKNAIEQFKRYGVYYSSFNNFKFSHKVDKKFNRSLSDDTLYSTRINPMDNTEWKIAKISDLYVNNKSSAFLNLLSELFENSPEKTLMYEADKLSYLKLKKVYDEYKDKTTGNPFYLYFTEFGYITKNSNTGHGPAIKSLKYYDCTVKGNPLDLSHKFNCKPGKRVIKEGLKTYRIDVYKAVKGYKIVRISTSMASGTVSGLKQLEIEKTKQNISNDDEFLFSLYKNDLFELNGQLLRFRGYTGGNRIYVQYHNKYNLDLKGNPQSLKFSIGSRTFNVKKINSGSLGIRI